MNYIVLVKQVPDIRNIPPDAWDWEKGTLRRGMLDTVCNELDRQALAFAAALRSRQDGKVVVLTMGPPFATEVLRYALSICADHAVLLTDRKLGGADTPATAYPLSQSIRKIEKEIFGGDRDYLIITGMQSVDGDTAQVPPQVAEELGIPHIAYATSFRFEGDALQVARITRNGKEVLSPKSYPALITVTGWTEPPFASFGRTAWAFDQEIITWSAADVEADPARIGLTGSRTTVNRIFSPKDVSTKNCEYVTDMHRLVEKIKQLYDVRLSSKAANGGRGGAVPAAGRQDADLPRGGLGVRRAGRGRAAPRRLRAARPGLLAGAEPQREGGGRAPRLRGRSTGRGPHRSRGRQGVPGGARDARPLLADALHRDASAS